MTPAADLRIFACAMPLQLALAACGPVETQNADYVAGCQREFRIAKEMAWDTLRDIESQRPWISVEDYNKAYGEPASGHDITWQEPSGEVLVRAKMPDHLIEVAALNHRTLSRIANMESVLAPIETRPDSPFDAPLNALDLQDQQTRRKIDLIESGKKEEDLLPKLEECFRRLK